MPTEYKRKEDSNRGQWLHQDLLDAIRAVKNEGISMRAASKKFQVPARTLRRRIELADYSCKTLGHPASLGPDNERKIVGIIRELEKNGFSMSKNDLRKLVFKFAESQNIKHKFNRETKMAGYAWLHSFLRRNKDVVLASPKDALPETKSLEVYEDKSEVFNLSDEVLDEALQDS